MSADEVPPVGYDSDVLARAVAEHLAREGGMTPEAQVALRAQFPDAAIGKLPRITCGDCTKAQGKACAKHPKAECSTCGNWITPKHVHIDYVGHADTTDRLLQVDPGWTWEPAALDERGLPLVVKEGGDAVLWIRLTVRGVTRLGVGTAPAGSFELHKQLIGDAIRNAAMRFGVALDLWHKHEAIDAATPEPSTTSRSRGSTSRSSSSRSRQQAEPKAEPAELPEGMVERREANRELLEAFLALGLSDDEAKAEVKAAWKARHLGNGPIPRRIVDEAVAEAGTPPPLPAECPECSAPAGTHRGGCPQAPFAEATEPEPTTPDA